MNKYFITQMSSSRAGILATFPAKGVYGVYVCTVVSRERCIFLGQVSVYGRMLLVGLCGWCAADVDECREELHTCAFRCQNIVGSFRCTCPRGYQVSNDGKHCEGMTQRSLDIFMTS